MAHAHVTLDVEGGRAGESESLHVSEHLGLEHTTLAPRASEPADQLVVHGATMNRHVNHSYKLCELANNLSL